MLTIDKVITLSKEVKEGKVHGVVDLWKLLQEGPALEKSPDEVLGRTYLTGALKNVLGQIQLKLTGQDSRGGFAFTGGYGSGKSHHQLALYHLFAYPDKVQAWLEEQGYDFSPPQGVEAIVLHPSWKQYKYLWTPIFEALGRQDVLEQVVDYPTVEIIKQAISNKTVAVFIDEVESWYGSISTRRDGGARKNANRFFIQHLLDVANEPDVSLLVFFSLLRVNREITDVIDRTNPFTENLGVTVDKEKIILFRLLSDVGKPKAAQVIQNYIDFYRGRDFAIDDYQEYQTRMAALYPFHPEFVRVLFTRYVASDNYQNTRGILYLLSEVLRKKASLTDLLLLSDVDMEEFEGELVKLDRELVENGIKDIRRNEDKPFAKEILGTIFFYSLGRGAGAGAEEPDILLGTVRPTINPNDIKLTLSQLLGEAWYLHKLNSRYALRTDENIFAVVQNRAGGVSDKEAVARLARVLRYKVFGRLTYVHGVDEIQDNRELKIVAALHPLRGEEIDQLFKGRQFQNRLILVTPQVSDLCRDEDLLAKAKRIVGGEDILERVAKERQKGIQKIIEDEEDELIERLEKLYGWWLKFTPEGMRRVPVTPKASEVVERARGDKSYIKNVMLDALEARKSQGLKVSALFENFYILRDCPIVEDEGILNMALKELCQEEKVLLVGDRGTRYFGETPIIEKSMVVYHHLHVTLPPEKEEAGQMAPPVGVEVPGRRIKYVPTAPPVEPSRIPLRVPVPASGKHPRVVASNLEPRLRSSDVIREIKVEISNDFSDGTPADDLARILKLMGLGAQGDLNLGITLQLRGSYTRDEVLGMVQALPATPGGLIYVTLEVDREEE